MHSCKVYKYSCPEKQRTTNVTISVDRETLSTRDKPRRKLRAYELGDCSVCCGDYLGLNTVEDTDIAFICLFFLLEVVVEFRFSIVT